VHTCDAAKAADGAGVTAKSVLDSISALPVFEAAMGNEAAAVEYGEWLMVIMIQWRKPWSDDRRQRI
jgi:hypothetical protein